MRIAYLLAWRGGAASGPFRKMAGQVHAWLDAGHEVGLFVATSSAAEADWRQFAGAGHQHLLADDSAHKLAQRRTLATAAADWEPDLVYERHGLYYPGHGRLTRRRPVVTEINANDLYEWPLLSRSKSVYNRLTRDRGLAGVAGLVFVTNELRDAAAFARYSAAVPSLVLGNGIDLRSVPRAEVAADDGPPRVLFVGHHSSPWHGIEDVLALASARPHWQFDIVGLRETELSRAPANVVGHGQLMPHDYASVMAAADVGLGSLGLHRERINEASALKVREYLAAGLPVVIGGKDTDFPDGAPFLLEVPNVSGGVLTALSELDRFVAGWRGRRVPLDDVRHLDVAEKEGIRLAFFERVLQGAGP
jgi:glycosyltransferase involved in cell wall biosynthesis